MDLTKGLGITRGRITVISLTETVKNKVELMALKQGIKHLKFINKKGVTLKHHDWIAGVDYGILENDGQPTDQNKNKVCNFEDGEMMTQKSLKLKKKKTRKPNMVQH